MREPAEAAGRKSVSSPASEHAARRTLSAQGSSTLRVGDKVLIGSDQLKGVVRFSGPTHFAPGEWLGIVLDEPQGRNDGLVKGERYFQCKPLHGLFVRPNHVVRAPADAEARAARGGAGPRSAMPIDDASDYEGEATPAGRKKQSLLDLHAADWVSVAAGHVHDGTGEKAAAVQLELANAVEDHNVERIRSVLPVAASLGVPSKELDSAQRVLNFQVGQLLINELEGVRAAVAKLSESVKAVEERAKEAERCAMAAASLLAERSGGEPATSASLVRSSPGGEKLEQRFWEHLEQRVGSVIESAVARATRELTASLNEAARLREAQRSAETRAQARFSISLALSGAADRLRSGSCSPSEPRAYGKASKRWRSAARRAMILRTATSAWCIGRGTKFAAERVVGPLEASLAVDEEFDCLMQRWGQRRTMASPVQLRDRPEPEPQRGPPEAGGAADPGPARPPAAAGAAPGRRTHARALPAPAFHLQEGAGGGGAPAAASAARCCLDLVLRRAASRLQARGSILRAVSLASGRPDGPGRAPAAAAARAPDSEAGALRASEEILAARRRMERAQAEAERRVDSLCAKLQAAERGRQSRKSLALRRASLKAEQAGSDPMSVATDIEASRKRMETALLETEEKVVHATTKIQAASRGRRARKELELQHEKARFVQKEFRGHLKRKKLNCGDGPESPNGTESSSKDEFSEEERVRRQRWDAIFAQVVRSTVCPPPVDQGEVQDAQRWALATGSLDKGAFAAALREAHPEVTAGQSTALWDGFLNGTDCTSMDARTFCEIAEALTAGSHAAAEFADVSEESFKAMGAEAPPGSSRLPDAHLSG